MTDTTRPPAPGRFWRCPSCGTPNPAAAYVASCLGCGRRRTRSAVVASGPDPLVSAAGAARPLLVRAVWTVSLVYAAAVLVVLGLMHWVGGEWWGVTLLLFMPRWLLLIPPLGLAAVSGLTRQYWQWALQGATSLVVAGPLMGLSLPLATLWERAPSGTPVRVGTFNMAQVPTNVPAFGRWVSDLGLDAVFIQEGKRNDPKLTAFFKEGWHLNRLKSIATRFPIVAELESLPQAYDSDERYSSAVDRVKVRTPGGAEVLLVSVHLPTLRFGFRREFRGDVAGLKRHTAWWGREMSRTLSLLAGDSELPMIVGGDFNMPDDDSTMAALRSSFRFAFEEAGWGYGYTRPAHFPWVRIDHLLSSPEWSVAWCRRGPDLGSDHLPLAAEFVLPAASASPRTAAHGKAAAPD